MLSFGHKKRAKLQTTTSIFIYSISFHTNSKLGVHIFVFFINIQRKTESTSVQMVFEMVKGWAWNGVLMFERDILGWRTTKEKGNIGKK